MVKLEESGDELLSKGAVIPFRDGEVDISKVSERMGETIAIDSSGTEAILSEAIHGGASIASAIAQGEHVLVVYPEGACWDSLMDRKTLGLEGLKHPVAKADDGGVGGGFAALKRAGVSSATMLDIAMHVASFVVGQSYMRMIDRDLQGIREGIDEVVGRIGMRNHSDLCSYESTLSEYQQTLWHKAERENDRRDITGDIRRIRSEIANIYQNELDVMESSADGVSRMRAFDEKSCSARISEFVSASQRCYYALCLETFARRLLVDYEGDYSADNINGHYEVIRSKGDVFITGCKDGLSLISDSLRGERDHGGKSGKVYSVIADDGCVSVRRTYDDIGGFLANVVAPSMHKEMRQRMSLLKRASSVSIPTVDWADAFAASLDERRFLHRESNAVIISRDAIQPLLLKEGVRLEEVGLSSA